MGSAVQNALLRTVTRVSTALRSEGIRFILTGGCAVYARGGPETEHDVDVLVREDDAPHAVRTLVGAGMRAAEAPEEWLCKVYDGDRLVDIIFRPNDRPVTEEMLARSEEMRVGPARVPVQFATDVLVGKLLALGPLACDFTNLLPIARALREQIDWERLSAETAKSPYAEAFLVLAHRLGITQQGVHA
ncbi:MAG TPA: hypothetical protein VGX25_05870 [Actinophytocola sp.]|uniref:nucleotidyltransferase family protein n=1 Tax=Actinophytocola sp. TaxID=1872138 RepID=UPI002DDDAE6A|nr:hypothetical protein [Actinophytocola sp.]HEV2778912.1 hypothetical protein [Actinophytocola sp.]